MTSRLPCTTVNAPSGSPASFHSSARNMPAPGSRVGGLSTKVLPVASATGDIHSGIITGKLNGVMPATTPTGWRKEYTSIPVAAWSEYSPLSSVGMLQANSTTSRPRLISPLASESTLPCSRVTISASSSVCSTSSSRNRNITAVRLASEYCDQTSNAAAALAIAVSTSAGVAEATWATTSPVAGLSTGTTTSSAPTYGLPSIQCGMVGMVLTTVSFDVSVLLIGPDRRTDRRCVRAVELGLEGVSTSVHRLFIGTCADLLPASVRAVRVRGHRCRPRGQRSRRRSSHHRSEAVFCDPEAAAPPPTGPGSRAAASGDARPHHLLANSLTTPHGRTLQ